jgi:hypothetical protein
MTSDQFAARLIQGLARANALHNPGLANTWLRDRVPGETRKAILAALFDATPLQKAV